MRKYQAKFYAKAISKVLAKDMDKKEVENALTNFLSIVEKNQDQKELRKISQIAQDLLQEKFGINQATFESARPLSLENIKKLKETLGKDDIYNEKINPELLAGLKIIKNGNEQIDFSLANKIKNILKI